MKQVFLFFTIALGLTACKTVSIKNGEVPSEYLSRAKQVEGIYHGHFDGRPGTLKINFEGSRPTLSFQDSQNGESFVSSQCGAQVGHLNWAEVSQKGLIKNVGFKFTPGICRILGRDVVLSFSKDINNVQVSILQKKGYREGVCHYQTREPRVGIQKICEKIEYDIFLKGRFSR